MRYSCVTCKSPSTGTSHDLRTTTTTPQESEKERDSERLSDSRYVPSTLVCTDTSSAQCQFQWVQVLEILLEKKPREGTCALLCPPLGAPSAAPCAVMSISDRLGPRMRSSFDLSPTLEPVAAALYRCVAPHPHCALNTPPNSVAANMEPSQNYLGPGEWWE